jgi:hypothetical protein
MTFQIFVENPSQNSYLASVIGFPGCIAEGDTKEQAIAKVAEGLKERLSRGEIVAVEVENGSRLQADDPWLRICGMFEDDPTWDDFQANIAQYRRELDAEEAKRNEEEALREEAA